MKNQSDAITLAESFVEDGFTAVKVKVGDPDFRKDIDLVREIRSALGDDIEIMLDANGAYDTLTALKFAQGVAPFDIFWFEEPFYPEDVDAYLGLKRDTDIPLAAGECESTHYNYKNLITSRVVDVVQPNISRVGGFTAARNVAVMADAHNIPVAPHGVGGAIFLAASLHFSAAIPNFISLEYNRRPNPLRDGLIDEGFDFQNGYLSIPSGPGLGIQIDNQTLEKVRIQ
jgi:L-alanine-DL-glutamate epimerase-like enolase superfamily enzyme